MRLNNIKFSENEEPEELTVTMSVEEATWIARIAGKQRGSSPHDEIYSCLIGSFFNKMWEDGVEGAPDVIIPPIKYDD